MIALVALALAAPPADAPWQVALDLPPTGPVRVAVPDALIGDDPDTLAATLRLCDGAGGDVPFTVVSSLEPPPDGRLVDLSVVGADTWRVERPDGPLEVLEIDIANWDEGPFVARIGDGPETFLYQAQASGNVIQRNRVPVPAGDGPLELHLRAVHGEAADVAAVRGVPRLSTTVGARERPVSLADARTDEEGVVRIPFDTGGPRRLTGLRLVVAGDLFDRGVALCAVEDELETGCAYGRVSRLRLGGIDVDETTLGGLSVSGDRFVLRIDGDGGRPLDVTGAYVYVAGVDLYAVDVGPGPHVLYGGAPPRPESTDARLAREALLRLASPAAVVPAAAVEPNAAFVSAVEGVRTDGVDRPALPLEAWRWRWRRAIDAAPGWVRVPLDRAVLAHAAAGLGDLRVVDVEDRQVPYLVRRTGLEDAWPTAPFTRAEEGSATRLRLPLDLEAPVTRLRLHTPAEVFDRGVQVRVDRGARTETVRAASWRHDAQGPSLSITLDQVVGRELLVEIENGDNPPLPIDAVEVWSPAWELRVRVPEGGARLLYGGPADPPQYDLELLRRALSRSPVGTAALGPEEATPRRTLAGAEKAVTVGAVVVLAAGLAWMTLRVLREGRA